MAELSREGGGRLPENLMHFGRVLRRAGLPIGPDRIIDALRAVDCVGVDSRADLNAALSAVFVDRREHQAIFDQAFAVFWRNPQLLQRVLKTILDRASGGGGAVSGPEVARRLAEALATGGMGDDTERGEEVEAEASITWSAEERFQTQDFEDMSAAELSAARVAVARLRLAMNPLVSRRFRADPHGSEPDPRATLRAGTRAGADVIDMAFRRRRVRPPTVVVLCDISGSMSQYARIFLHFAHALTAQRQDVHTLLFGTRLTNVTRMLRARDPDAAMAAVGTGVTDWSGGTRIGEALATFNRRWARRLLAQGAVVLLMTDGLDRDAGAGIEPEIGRLHRLCRRLIWLNPLLRYEGFEAKAAGVRALLPHVDEFRPVHNLRSLSQLADALAGRRASSGERHDLRHTAGGR